MDDFLEKLKKDRDAVKAKEAAEYDAKIKQRNETAASKKQTGQSGFTSAQKSEMVSLENQRRQAQVDMDIDTMNALDARMKAIRASAGQQTIGDRADDTFSTAVASTVSGGVNFAGLMLDSLRNLNTAALEQKELSELFG